MPSTVFLPSLMGPPSSVSLSCSLCQHYASLSLYTYIPQYDTFLRSTFLALSTRIRHNLPARLQRIFLPSSLPLLMTQQIKHISNEGKESNDRMFSSRSPWLKVHTFQLNH